MFRRDDRFAAVRASRIGYLPHPGQVVIEVIVSGQVERRADPAPPVCPSRDVRQQHPRPHRRLLSNFISTAVPPNLPASHRDGTFRFHYLRPECHTISVTESSADLASLQSKEIA